MNRTHFLNSDPTPKYAEVSFRVTLWQALLLRCLIASAVALIFLLGGHNAGRGLSSAAHHIQRLIVTH